MGHLVGGDFPENGGGDGVRIFQMPDQPDTRLATTLFGGGDLDTEFSPVTHPLSDSHNAVDTGRPVISKPSSSMRRQIIS